MKSLKEKAILASVVMVLLYALAGAIWFMGQDKEWEKARKQYEKAKTTYLKECRLIDEHAKWEDAYEEEKSQMRIFETGKATDTTWLPKMDEIAKKHYITINQSQGGKEVEVGDVVEFPIEVKNWEGALESLVKFMHELENTDEGMFDIRSLNFRPSAKKGYLKGSFTLTCAYMREK